MTFTEICAAIIIIWVFIYTISFGRWNWKKKNKLGAVMIYLLAVLMIMLPVYTVYFKG